MSYPIQDIFLKYYKSAVAKYPVDEFTDKVAHAIMECKTAALGGNASVCQDCGHMVVHYNSCRNRHCPCCQGLVKEKWIDKRKTEVIDAPYFHVVFTVPEELNSLIYTNKELLYALLYRASADTLTTLARDKKYLGASIGFMSILHTWGQTLNFHPHIHCVVLGGGLTKEQKFKTVKGNSCSLSMWYLNFFVESLWLLLKNCTSPANWCLRVLHPNLGMLVNFKGLLNFYIRKSGYPTLKKLLRVLKMLLNI